MSRKFSRYAGTAVRSDLIRLLDTRTNVVKYRQAMTNLGRELGLVLARQLLVMVKSIIGTSCVVRTNLTKLLDDAAPKQIFVGSPVMYKRARPNLESEFPRRIVDRFKYLHFATDSEMQGSMVVPGVGGSVYELLGVGSAKTKNRFRPRLVKERRDELEAR